MKKYSGKLVDIVNKRIYKAEIHCVDGCVKKVIEKDEVDDVYLFPGFVDAHIHIESSMLSPQNFAKEAVRHGTVAVVSDPHEIANVLGLKGVNFMIKDSENSPLKFYFGAPSCVPATAFETSGASLDVEEVESLLKRDDIYFLSEMMNYPGVIYQDAMVMDKINLAKKYGKHVDGHAPGLNGEDLEKYVNAGIGTDHECFTYEEAVEKINLGMRIQIREGSAAKNFDNLFRLIDEFPEKVMLCSDDLHPDDLLKGHVNLLIKRALKKGCDFYNVMRAAIYNPIKYYKLNVGMLQEGDTADFLVLKDLNDFNIICTVINGEEVFSDGKVNISSFSPEKINNFVKNDIKKEDLIVRNDGKEVKLIKVLDGELITKAESFKLSSNLENFESNTKEDILKIVVINRYKKEKPSVGFIRGFGFKNGGIASSIAHDSHNIIIAACKDEIILELLEWINGNEGGIAVNNGSEIHGLALPIAGILSDEDAGSVGKKYSELDKEVKKLGTKLRAPFMTLSFMALLVIPELKIGNRGMFDGLKFESTSLYK